MPTLILSPRYTPDSAALWKAALDLGWSVERLEAYRVPDHLYGKECVIYGEGLFVSTVAESLGLPLIEPPVDWMIRLPSRYLQREVRYTTLGDVRKTLRQATFVKPGDGAKGFDSKVYASVEELPSIEAWDDDTPVIMSEPVKWEAEYRCFVIGREVVTLSVYLRAGEFMEDQDWNTPIEELSDARNFANDGLRDESVAVPRGMVLDVGKIEGKGWAVIEANPAFAAGIYGCEPEKILKVLEQIFST
jgi:hypothetical protein